METWRSHPFLGALIPAPTARPENCASFPVTPSFCLDPEARRLHSPLGVPVRSATACDERPCRLNQILKAGAKTVASAHVLHHAEPPVRPENAPHFGEPLRRIRDATEHETAHHRVEDTLAKRQSLRAGAHERNCRRSPAGAPQCVRGRIEPNRARLARKQPQATSSAAA